MSEPRVCRSRSSGARRMPPLDSKWRRSQTRSCAGRCASLASASSVSAMAQAGTHSPAKIPWYRSACWGFRRTRRSPPCLLALGIGQPPLFVNLWAQSWPRSDRANIRSRPVDQVRRPDWPPTNQSRWVSGTGQDTEGRQWLARKRPAILEVTAGQMLRRSGPG
jgi:hypothetical protein